MSSSKGNVVAPSEIVERYGADAARCFVLFMGPRTRTPRGRTPESRACTGSSRACGGSATSSAKAGTRPTAAEQPENPTGDALALVRKANWAIDKVTRRHR